MTTYDIIAIEENKPQLPKNVERLGIDKTCVLSYLGKCKVRSILRKNVFNGINEVMLQYGTYSIYGAGLADMAQYCKISDIDDLELTLDDLLFYVGRI